MATKLWIGAVAAVAQVNTWLFAGTWEATDVVTVTIGSKSVSITAGSTVAATVAATVQAALAALSTTLYPEFAEITWTVNSATITGTGTTAGVPFTATFFSSETGGGNADGQTIEGVATGTLTATGTTGTAATACTGPNWVDVAGNWSGGLPADADDIVFADSNVSALYGLSNSSITPATIRIDQSFTGTIGLPRYNATAGAASAYFEYRNTYLAYGTSGDSTNIAVTIGRGKGDGSGRIKLDFGTSQFTMNVYGKGNAIDSGIPALLIKGTHASNSLNVNVGDVGVAFFAGETSTVVLPNIGYAEVPDSDASVVFGDGVTITTGVNISGGAVYSRSNVGTVTQTGGTLYVDGAATSTLYNIDGGSTFHRSTGTITNFKIGDGGKLDFSQDMRARTATNGTLTKGATLNDPFRTVTFTNAITLERCAISDVTLDLGTHITLQRANAA